MPQNLDIFSNNPSQQQSSTKLSIQLFGPSQFNSQQKVLSACTKKSQHFRQSIRREQNQKIFKNLRNKMNNCQKQDFFQFLKQNSQKFSLNQKNMETLIQCINDHMKNASFALKIIEQDFKIWKQLTNLLSQQNQNLSCYTKKILVKGLVYLTYFNQKVAQEIAQTNFIEFVIKQLDQLKIDSNDEVSYLLSFISLMVNIASIRDKNMNHYFIDSKLINVICEKIDATFILRDYIINQQKSKQNKNLNENVQNQVKCSSLYLIQSDIKSLYFQFITLLKNICKEVDKPISFVERIINYFMVNEFVKTHNTTQIFSLIAQIFKDSNATERLLEQNWNFCQWYGSIVEVCQKKFVTCTQNQNYILTQEQKECFSNFLKNIVNLNSLQCQKQLIKDIFIKQLINWIYLSQFTIQSFEKKQKEYVKIALQVYETFSDIEQIQIDILLTVRKGRNYKQLLSVFVNSKFLCYFKTGIKSMSILINLLSKNSQILKALMEQNLFDSIRDFFQPQNIQHQPSHNIILIYDLLTLMVDSQRRIRPNNKNQIVKIIVNEGLLKQIQKNQNHQNSEVYHKAEMFIKYIETFF